MKCGRCGVVIEVPVGRYRCECGVYTACAHCRNYDLEGSWLGTLCEKCDATGEIDGKECGECYGAGRRDIPGERPSPEWT